MLISSPQIEQARRIERTIPSEHDPFEFIREERMETLPLAKLQLPDDPRDAKRKLVMSYTESVHDIRRMHEELDRLMDGVIEAFVWVGANDAEFKLYREKLREQKSSLERVPLQIVDSLFAEVMAHEPEEIKTILVSSLSETLQVLMNSFQEVLQNLQGKRVIGSIEWFGPDTCTYDFYRVKRSENLTATRNESRTEDKIEHLSVWEGPYGRVQKIEEITDRFDTFETKDVLEHHEHQLFNAARHRFPARQVRKPVFISRFMQKIPKWLATHIFVVEGDMCRNTIQDHPSHISSREHATEVSRTIIQQGYLYSPAVTLGEFVLTGWSGADR